MTSKQIKMFHEIVTELQKHDEKFDDFLSYEIDKELEYMETGIDLKKIAKYCLGGLMIASTAMIMYLACVGVFHLLSVSIVR